MCVSAGHVGAISVHQLQALGLGRTRPPAGDSRSSVEPDTSTSCWRSRRRTSTACPDFEHQGDGRGELDAATRRRVPRCASVEARRSRPDTSARSPARSTAGDSARPVSWGPFSARPPRNRALRGPPAYRCSGPRCGPRAVFRAFALQRAPDFARRTAATGQVVGSDVQYLEYCGRFASAVSVSVCVAQVTGQQRTARIVV